MLIAIYLVLTMIFRLCTSRLTLAAEWQKVLSFRTLQIPKINHHTLFTSSSSSVLINCKKHKFNDARLFHQKQQKNGGVDEGVIKTVVKSIRSNPYVRIARLDRPIGKLFD